MMRSRLFIFAALFAAGSAAAAPAQNTLTPTGPVTVTADRAEFDKSGTMVYQGNVQLSSDSLKLSGEKLVLQQFENGQYEAKINGKPARLEHAGVTGQNGESAAPIQAEAANLNYDTRSGIIDVLGQAQMTRGKDQINGDNIRYNVGARRIEAAGGSGGQVKIVIQPPAQKNGATP